MEILGRLGRFGAGHKDLQPKDVLRKVIDVLEDNCKEGLDDKVYVPNKYVLEFAINERERSYLFSFMDEAELVTVLQQFIVQHGYFTRAPLEVVINEVEPSDRSRAREKLHVTALFEKVSAPAPVAIPHPVPNALAVGPEADAADAGDDLATVGAISLADDDLTRPALGWAALAITASDGGKRLVKLTKPVVYIGRSRNAGNDIVLENDDKASKVHARMEREPDGQYTLYDLDSTNGVMIADVPIKGNRVLRNLDEITIGSTKLVFQAGTPSPDVRMPVASPQSLAGQSPVMAAPELLPPPIPMAAPASASDEDSQGKLVRAELVSSTGVPYVLASETSIGRGVTAGIVLDDPSVSTRHARILASDAATYYLEDLGSENGTSINARNVVRDQRVLLASGDILVFGQTEMRFIIVPR